MADVRLGALDVFVTNVAKELLAKSACLLRPLVGYCLGHVVF